MFLYKTEGRRVTCSHACKKQAWQWWWCWLCRPDISQVFSWTHQKQTQSCVPFPVWDCAHASSCMYYFGVIRREKLVISLQCMKEINGKGFTLRGLEHLKPPVRQQPNADFYQSHMQDEKKNAAAKWVQRSSWKAPCGMMWHKFFRVETCMTDMSPFFKKATRAPSFPLGFLPDPLPSDTRVLASLFHSNKITLCSSHKVVYLHYLQSWPWQEIKELQHSKASTQQPPMPLYSQHMTQEALGVLFWMNIIFQ